MKRIQTKMNFVVLNIIIAFSLFSSVLYTNSPYAEGQAGRESTEAWKEYQKQLKELQESIDKPSPRQQIASGIRYIDVVCDNDFVLLFKWSGNSQACVKPQSAEKLVERGWGVLKDQTIFFGLMSQCKTDFIIHYNDPSQYKESKIIKTIRDALSEVDLTPIVGDYTYQWEYISFLTKLDNESKVGVSVEGNYIDSGNEYQKEGYKKIIEAFQSMKGVANIGLENVLCR